MTPCYAHPQAGTTRASNWITSPSSEPRNMSSRAHEPAAWNPSACRDTALSDIAPETHPARALQRCLVAVDFNLAKALRTAT
jgi:hypothetical protein